MKCFVIYLDFSLNNHIAKTTIKTKTACGQQLRRDIFEFDQGHVTKNQPITVLILLLKTAKKCTKNCITGTPVLYVYCSLNHLFRAFKYPLWFS